MPFNPRAEYVVCYDHIWCYGLDAAVGGAVQPGIQFIATRSHDRCDGAVTVLLTGIRRQRGKRRDRKHGHVSPEREAFGC